MYLTKDLCPEYINNIKLKLTVNIIKMDKIYEQKRKE